MPFAPETERSNNFKAVALAGLAGGRMFFCRNAKSA